MLLLTFNSLTQIGYGSNKKVLHNCFIPFLAHPQQPSVDPACAPERPEEVLGQQHPGGGPALDAQPELRGRDRPQCLVPQPDCDPRAVRYFHLRLSINAKLSDSAKVLGVKVTNSAARLRSEE